MRAKFKVNGREVEVEVEPRLTLADCLRHHLRLTGTHVGCEHGICGACTVLLDGHPVRSCTTRVAAAEGKPLRTIEGLAEGDKLHPLQEAFLQADALQCGYCTPGMIMASAALLAENPNPTEDEVRHALEGNLCRCTGYHNIVKSVLAAAQEGVSA